MATPTVINSSVQVSQRQEWKVSRLKPYENNTLVHTAEDVSSLATKIQEYGFVDPITVDEDGVILWGHKRRLAAIQLKLATVPVVVVTGLSAAQKQALRIAHNKEGRKSEWDTGALLQELKSLEDQAFSLEGTGFGVDEIDTLFKDLKALEASVLPASEPSYTPDPEPELVFDDPTDGEPGLVQDHPAADTYDGYNPTDEVDTAPTSSVRVLQLFLDEETIEEAMDLIEALHLRFGTSTPTACVLAALRYLVQ